MTQCRVFPSNGSTNMKTYRYVVILLSLALFGSVRQSSAQEIPGVIRIDVNLVQLDAVVTDGKGKPVTNLKADDFEILQDNKVQKIRNFEFVRVSNPLTIERLPVVSGRSDSVSPPSTSAPRREDVLRTIALVVDDIGLSYDSTIRVRSALRKWVDTEMQPGDLVSVVRTDAAMGALQQFTNDKRLLYSAIDHLRYQPGRIGVGSFTAFEPALEQISDPSTGQTVPWPDTTGFDTELENAYLMSSFNAIRYVMQGLRDLPGRKSLVLFSEDMSLPNLDSSGQQRQTIEDRLRALADDANRASVVIYGVDPRGPVYTGPTAEDNLSGHSTDEIVSMISSRNKKFIDSEDTLILLSQRTGGLFLGNSNDLSGLLTRAVDDGAGYYLMGYQPEQTTFDPKEDTVKYHAIRVRVKKPGLKVRSRTGFYGIKDANPETQTPATPEAQLAKALVSPFATADLRVRLTTLFFNTDTEGSYIKTLMHFDAHDLTFAEQADGTQSASVDIAVMMFDGNGDPSQALNKTWSLRVPKSAFEDVLRKGLDYSVPVPVKKAGPYQLRIALRDNASRKLGSAMQFVDVPDVNSGRLTLSGIVMSADPPVAGTSEGNPSIRIFKAGTAVSYAYEVFNVPAGTKERALLQTVVRLYHDGQVVFESTPSPLKSDSADAKRVAVGNRIQLTKLPPGDYAMQVAVFDSAHRDPSHIAVQSTDFEVRE